MNSMILITGYAGAGKSTVAELFAKKYRAVLLRQDLVGVELGVDISLYL